MKKIFYCLFVSLVITTSVCNGQADEKTKTQMKNIDSGDRKQVLIDKFFIPKNSIEEFTQRMNYNRNFIKKLAGFVKDEVYEQTDDEGNKLIITITQWKNEVSINNAKNAVQTEYKKTGFNAPEFFQQLNVKAERGIYMKREE